MYKLYEKILSTRLSFPNAAQLSSQVIAFVSALVFVNPKNRLGSDGLEDVRKHLWFRDANFDWRAHEQMAIKPSHQPQLPDLSERQHSYEDLHTEILSGIEPCAEWQPRL